MNYAVTCECGKSILVRAGDAGSRLRCGCGNELSVPSLSILRESAKPESNETETPPGPANPTPFIAVTAVIVVVVGLLFTPLLFPIGVMMILLGRLWFAMQVLREMSLPNAMIVFFVPFMPTVFLFKRFDVAWKPFFFGVAGFIVSMVGSAAVAQ